MVRIRNWAKHQHFKDRRPPWIKLYRDLLEDIEWFELDGDVAKTLVALWLIASENDGQLPPVRKLAFRLRLDETVLKQHISKLSHWLEQDDDETISERYHDGPPETETETETEPPSVSAPDDAHSPPVDLKSQIFGPCLVWLADSAKRKESALRSMVGRWCSQYGDGPTLEALMAAQRCQTPVEPVAYIEKLLKTGGPRDGPHSRERQAALDAQVDQMISEAAERADAQHEQADHGPVGEAEFGFRASDAEDGRQRSKPEVRGTGGGLRRISAALPAVGIGGRN